MNSFRNHGAFHEDCTIAIGKKLVALLKPKYLRIGGYWYPRGGMPIDVFWQAGKIAAGRLGCPTRASRPIADAARFSGIIPSPAPAAAASARRSSPTPTITAAPTTKTGVMCPFERPMP